MGHQHKPITCISFLKTPSSSTKSPGHGKKISSSSYSFELGRAPNGMYVNCCSKCLNNQVVKARGPAFPDKYRQSAASRSCFELDTVSSENKTALPLFHPKYSLVDKPLRRRKTGDKRSSLYWGQKMLLSLILIFQCLEWPQPIFWVFVFPVHAFEVGFHRVTSQKTEEGERGGNVVPRESFCKKGHERVAKARETRAQASSQCGAAQRGVSKRVFTF